MLRIRTHAGCWLISFAIFLSATSADSLFTPADIAKLRSVTQATISPDGNHVAYGLSVSRDPLKDKDGPAWVELHVVDRDGISRPYVTGEVRVSDIGWTPDGTGIAYTAKRDGDQHSVLYVIPLHGGESVRRCEHDTSLGGYAFSPVDARIAFLANPKKDEQRDDFADRGFDQEVYEEQLTDRLVWITGAGSSEKARSLALPGTASAVSWSPDGKRLAVVLAPTPLVDDSYMFKRVHVVDVETGNVIMNVNNPGKLGAVRWSPDGKRLAMISAVDIHDPSEGHLFVVNVPGDGSMIDLMPEFEGQVEGIAWKNAETLLWVASERQQTKVGTVTIDGDVQMVLPARGPILGGLTLSGDGQSMAFTGHTAKHPSEVMLVTEGASEAKRLTDSNHWLSDQRFAEQVVYRWNARDDLALEGVLIYPLNYEEGIRHPLILSVHGGPEAHVSNGWVTSYSSPGQVAAARGFAVFYPNYRGSTGRGVEFSKMGQGDAAGKEFDDLVDAIDALDQDGVVDAKKVGITGGSYGGFASAWGATYYSDRFAASVMFVGISDNVSKYGTTDIPQEMYLVHQRKHLWEDWQFYLERSPIRYVERNKTPTLILHGKNDPRVHPSQSLELYRHLKTLNQAPVRLVLYEGEGHGNQKAAARLDYHLRMLQWMEHYLKGPGGPAPDAAIDYHSAK